MHRQRNKEKGITMITLAVTIIVLIILAGVSINMLVGDNGIITKAQLFDIAGNVWEWTEEESHYAGNYTVARGGSSLDSSATYPVCHRQGDTTVNYTSITYGFRVVLYIK